jgi:hypothetical protein
MLRPSAGGLVNSRKAMTNRLRFSARNNHILDLIGDLQRRLEHPATPQTVKAVAKKLSLRLDPFISAGLSSLAFT